jgi:hypothetical protein
VADRAGLENRCGLAATADVNPVTTQPSTDTAENSSDDLASCLALLTRKSPDLALIAERWDRLPEAVRAGIVAMVKASS